MQGRLYFVLWERLFAQESGFGEVQEAYINGVSTRKIERLVKKLGIENISRSQISEMTRGLNEQVDAFRNRSLEGEKYPVLWTDAIYEDGRMDSHVISEAVIGVCGV